MSNFSPFNLIDSSISSQQTWIFIKLMNCYFRWINSFKEKCSFFLISWISKFYNGTILLEINLSKFYILIYFKTFLQTILSFFGIFRDLNNLSCPSSLYFIFFMNNFNFYSFLNGYFIDPWVSENKDSLEIIPELDYFLKLRKLLFLSFKYFKCFYFILVNFCC